MALNVKTFALVCGLLWGLGVFVLTWWIIYVDGITKEKTILGRVYRGYSVSPRGSLIGFMWAFVDGWISGAALAVLYNFIHSCITK